MMQAAASEGETPSADRESATVRLLLHGNVWRGVAEGDASTVLLYNAAGAAVNHPAVGRFRAWGPSYAVLPRPGCHRRRVCLRAPGDAAGFHARGAGDRLLGRRRGRRLSLPPDAASLCKAVYSQGSDRS